MKLKTNMISRLKWENNQLKYWNRQQTHKMQPKMKCMTYEPHPSLIPRVVSVVDIGEEVMNVMKLVTQVLEPCCAICMMCILSHVEVLKLVENHSLELGVCKSSILRRVIKLNYHWLRFIFLLVSSTSFRFMIICSNFNVCTLISFN